MEQPPPPFGIETAAHPLVSFVRISKRQQQQWRWREIDKDKELQSALWNRMQTATFKNTTDKQSTDFFFSQSSAEQQRRRDNF